MKNPQEQPEMKNFKWNSVQKGRQRKRKIGTAKKHWNGDPVEVKPHENKGLRENTENKLKQKMVK